MATKVLDLLLQLSVKGTSEAAQLQKAVESLKSTVTGFKGRSLDDILNGTKAKADLDLVVDKTKALFDLITKGGKTPLNLNLDKVKSDLDLVVQKGRQFFDLIATKGQTRIDLNLNEVSRQLDLVVQKGRQLFDLVATKGKTRIDFDLSKLEKETTAARDKLRQLHAEMNQTPKVQRAAAQAADEHRQSIAALGREFLLFRRVLFGLGIIGLVREVGQLVQAFDQARQSLKAVFGESQAAEEFSFIREQAERLGLQITGLAKEYARFSAAAKSLGIDQQLVRDNFLAVAEAGAKLALSSEQVEGALTAIQQIASKGRLSMEELRQQLGDRLPGAISIAAKGLQVTEARLFALVEAGQVTSDMFLKTFPAALRASFGTDQSTRIETTTATLQRFKNALSELTDEAIRAGALDAFLGIVKSLTQLFRDPATAQWLKDVSSGIASITKFARENIEAIKTLLSLYVGFRLFGTLTSAITGLGKALGAITVSATGVAPALAGTAVAVKSVAGAAAEGAPKVSNLATAMGSLALATKSPIVIAVAGLAALDAALVEAFIAKLDRAREKSLELAEAQRQIGSQGRLVDIIKEQISALEDYTGTVALTKEGIASLSEEGLRYYKKSAEGAQRLATLQAQLNTARIAQLQAELKAIELTNDTSTEALTKVVLYKDEIAKLTKEQQSAVAAAQSFATSLELVAQRASKQGIAFDENIRRLQELGKTFETVKKQGEAVTAIRFGDLDKDAQRLVESFRKVIEEGKGVAKAFETLIPKDFAEGGVKAITDVGNALAFLRQEGELTAKVIGEELAKAMDKLTANDLQKFAVQAQAAFEGGKLSAQGLALILDGQLRASLKNLGLDADTAGQKISKTFGELVSNFRNVAENAKATGDQIKGALDVAVQTAKTREELLLVRDTVDQLGIAAGQFGEKLNDSLLRLDDKIRATAGILDSALGDSFKRLGINTKAALSAMAEQAKIDFERIKQSGLASALEVEAAFKKMAEEVTKANNGIPPIDIVVRAVDFNAFDIIVKAAEKASERVKKAIEDAIPLADTKEKLAALADAIQESFDKGKLAVEDFGRLATEVGFKLRDAVAKPVGELAAAADLLGVKTKEQLKATADNARDAFNTIANSGQFTSQQLASAAQQYLDAYTAANDGVVDSFDPVVQKAQEVINKVNDTTNALNKMNTAGSGGGSGRGISDPISTGNLGDKTLQELQNSLQQTIAAYRAIGVQNVQDLQIVQAMQNEINKKGQENSDILRKRMEEQTEAFRAANNPGGGGGGGGGGAAGGVVGGVNNNAVTFNFNGGSAITPEAVKRNILPVLNSTLTRRR